MTIRLIAPAPAVFAALLLAACTPGGTPPADAAPEGEAESEMSAADHAAMGHDMPAAANATPGDAAFAASEAEMHRAMAAASGQTVDQAYIAKMIAHHQGAVAMAEVALAQSTDPEVRRMAQVVIDTQTREIAEMRAWTPAAGATAAP